MKSRPYLHELSIDFEFWSRFIVIEGSLSSLVNSIKEVFHGTRYDSNLFLSGVQVKSSSHCICLTRTSLKQGG